MPKSKTNKDRKENLTNFKNQKKTKSMSEKVTQELPPNFKPFKQVPVWEPEAKFEVTGAEFSALQQFFDIFATPISVMQSVFKRSLDAGIVQIKYQGEDGQEIPKEEIDNQLKQLQEFYASQAAQNADQTESLMNSNLEDLK